MFQRTLKFIKIQNSIFFLGSTICLVSLVKKFRMIEQELKEEWCFKEIWNSLNSWQNF